MKKLTRLALLVTLFSTIQVSIATANQLSRIITINFKNETLSKVLKNIGDKARIAICYNKHELQITKKITIQAQKWTTERILDSVLAGEAVRYKMIGNNLVIIPEATPANTPLQASSISETITANTIEKAEDEISLHILNNPAPGKRSDYFSAPLVPGNKKQLYTSSKQQHSPASSNSSSATICPLIIRIAQSTYL
ncbi:MAG: STN domain-containing protein [Chitinophagaceae bacterium]